MRSIEKLFDKLQNIGAYLSSLLFLALSSLIVTEIVLRSFFDKSTLIADEYSGYIYLASIFLALGYTFKENGHIRINLLTSRLSKKAQRVVDVVAGFIALALAIFMLYRSILLTYDSYSFEMVSETVSETPIYLTQIVMPIGLFLFVLSIISFISKRLRGD